MWLEGRSVILELSLSIQGVCHKHADVSEDKWVQATITPLEGTSSKQSSAVTLSFVYSWLSQEQDVCFQKNVLA